MSLVTLSRCCCCCCDDNDVSVSIGSGDADSDGLWLLDDRPPAGDASVVVTAATVRDGNAKVDRGDRDGELAKPKPSAGVGVDVVLVLLAAAAPFPAPTAAAPKVAAPKVLDCHNGRGDADAFLFFGVDASESLSEPLLESVSDLLFADDGPAPVPLLLTTARVGVAVAADAVASSD